MKIWSHSICTRQSRVKYSKFMLPADCMSYALPRFYGKCRGNKGKSAIFIAGIPCLQVPAASQILVGISKPVQWVEMVHIRAAHCRGFNP